MSVLMICPSALPFMRGLRAYILALNLPRSSLCSGHRHLPHRIGLPLVTVTPMTISLTMLVHCYSNVALDLAYRSYAYTTSASNSSAIHSSSLCCDLAHVPRSPA
ncbi:hypothetical protein BDR07DRAFT_249429 [Suillus spraguei]|nr:hypothetical protein BDR07DRAFT_249429 [Suillus spraguei]